MRLTARPCIRPHVTIRLGLSTVIALAAAVPPLPAPERDRPDQSEPRQTWSGRTRTRAFSEPRQAWSGASSEPRPSGSGQPWSGSSSEPRQVWSGSSSEPRQTWSGASSEPRQVWSGSFPEPRATRSGNPSTPRAAWNPPLGGARAVPLHDGFATSSEHPAPHHHPGLQFPEPVPLDPLDRREIPRDPWMPRPAVAPAGAIEHCGPWVRGPFESIQVNVDENGCNIVGDAANEPSIAVDPTNPDRIVIGWRQFDSVESDFR